MPTLTNVGANYDTIALSKELGVAFLDLTGVTSIRFLVFVNKVGTGTQSWQLWNVTNSAELAVIADAGATGDKTLEVTQAISGLAGVKLVRVRAKSTVLGDDPIFYGAAVWTT